MKRSILLLITGLVVAMFLGACQDYTAIGQDLEGESHSRAYIPHVYIGYMISPSQYPMYLHRTYTISLYWNPNYYYDCICDYSKVTLVSRTNTSLTIIPRVSGYWPMRIEAIDPTTGQVKGYDEKNFLFAVKPFTGC